jgi:hypothetical protein
MFIEMLPSIGALKVAGQKELGMEKYEQSSSLFYTSQQHVGNQESSLFGKFVS